MKTTIQNSRYLYQDVSMCILLQGRDELGRPLLERALAIQEKALGPDHPDVMAIRDVLNSEDD